MFMFQQKCILSFILFYYDICYFLTSVKFNMSQNAEIEGHVRYSAFKKTIKIVLTSTDTMDDLKTQINKYFEYHGEDHTTSHVFVQEPCVDLGVDKDKDMWKTLDSP